MPNEECGGDGLRVSSLTRILDPGALRAFPTVCLLAFLAACTPPAAPPPVSTDTPGITDHEALEQLRTGKVALDCGAPCASKWQATLPELQAHYNAGEWRDLALTVIRINYPQDLAYFYLGRAAEGLGARSSALTYYGTARSLATGTENNAKCAASQAGCNGLSLLTETLTRMQIVEEVRRGSRRTSHAVGQPAPDSWVDPEPASK
jgi:hypothetical protein